MTCSRSARGGGVVWVTGLSGAGKSTVAANLVARLTASGHRPICLDGDDLRSVLDAGAAVDAASRRDLGLRYGRLCRLLAGQGQLVVCATISLRHEVHAWNRTHLPRYVEVLLDVPVPELRRRDSKGIYRTDPSGRDIVGIGQAAEFPKRPDLVVGNFGPTAPSAAATQIFDFCRAKGLW